METCKQEYQYYFWVSKTITKNKTVVVEADSEDKAAEILKDALDKNIIDFSNADECIEIDYNIDDYPELKYMQILKK